MIEKKLRCCLINETKWTTTSLDVRNFAKVACTILEGKVIYRK